MRHYGQYALILRGGELMTLCFGEHFGVRACGSQFESNGFVKKRLKVHIKMSSQHILYMTFSSLISIFEKVNLMTKQEQ